MQGFDTCYRCLFFQQFCCSLARRLKPRFPPPSPAEMCPHRDPQISCELGDPYEVAEQTPIVWYLALRAADVFKTRNGRYPGEEDDQVGAARVQRAKKE